MACYHLERYEDAIDEALTALGLIYHQPASHWYLGLALDKLGECERAAEAFEVCLAIAPQMGEARNRLIELYERDLQQADKAAAHKAVFARMSDAGTAQADSSSETGGADDSQIDISGIVAPVTGIAPKTLPARPPIIVVSGLPRSGTSMLMQMLGQGGLPLFSDAARQADENNPRGYFEHEAVKRLHRDASWLAQAEGKAVKIVSQLLRALPARHTYKVVFILRELKEVIRSQQRMLARQGKPPSRPPAALRRAYQRNLLQVMRWAEVQHHVEMLYVNHHDVLQRPYEEAQKICHFLGQICDPAAMAAAVDRALYRERGSQSEHS